MDYNLRIPPDPMPYIKFSLGNLARYIIRACFSREHMVYLPTAFWDQNSVGQDVCQSRVRN